MEIFLYNIKIYLSLFFFFYLSFVEITLSNLIMTTTPLEYEDSETLYSYIADFYIDIKYLLC